MEDINIEKKYLYSFICNSSSQNWRRLIENLLNNKEQIELYPEYSNKSLVASIRAPYITESGGYLEDCNIGPHNLVSPMEYFKLRHQPLIQQLYDNTEFLKNFEYCLKNYKDFFDIFFSKLLMH